MKYVEYLTNMANLRNEYILNNKRKAKCGIEDEKHKQ